MIDLHLHTTASDGTCEPEELVRRVAAARIDVFAVTDHDTVAAWPRVVACAAGAGLETLPGIEITAVETFDGQVRDVHMLGYFFDPDHPGLGEFLARQRDDRARRIREMGDRLTALGKPIDVESIVGSQQGAKSLGRPLVARALVEAGHVGSIKEAFDDWIGEAGPAFVARRGIRPAGVVGLIGEAGGIVSIAHPGLLGHDELIGELAGQGMAALEAFHSDHDHTTTNHYLTLASRLGLAVTGGSDYHGDSHHRHGAFGHVGLPKDRFDELRACHADR